MPLFNNILAGAAGQSGGDAGYKIERSLRFNRADSASLRKTFATSGNRKKHTFSFWVKRSRFSEWHTILSAGNSSPAQRGGIRFQNTDKLEVTEDSGAFHLETSRVFRDPSAWYHIVVAYDSTQATASNRIKIYVNGVQETNFDTANYPNQNHEGIISHTNPHRIGELSFAGNIYEFGGYLADVHFLDGIAISNPDGVFGEFDADTGVWNPIEYTGNYNDAGVGQVYSGMLTSSNGFYSSSYTAEKAFDGNLNTGAWNTNDYDNYMEFTPTTPINFTNGVQVYCYAANGYNITNYYSVDLDGNGLGSETTFVGGGANFNGFAWISVATGSGTLHKLRIRLTRSGSGSGVEIRAIAIDGSGSSSNYLVDGTPAGVNGYHLDFDPNVAAVTYSTGGDNTNASNSGGHWEYLFNSAYGGASPIQNTTMTWTGNIPANGKNVRIAYRADSNAGGSIVVNSTSTTLSSGNFYTLQWVDLGTFSADITSMSVSRANVSMGGGIIFSYLEVDGQILINYEAPGADASGSGNHWNPNNITLTSFNAVANTTHVGTGTVTELKAVSGYNLFSIGTNNVGSDPGSAALVRFNFSALGLTAPATITFDSYEQGGGGWGTVSSNIYTDAGTVTSSYTTNGNTRSNTVNIPSGATYFELPGSWNAQYQLYYNGINNLVWDGTSYQHLGPEHIDSLLDSPTNYNDGTNIGGNYATVNPLVLSGNATFSEGNLQITGGGSNASGFTGVTINPQSGKFYFEVTTKMVSNTDGFYGAGVVEDYDFTVGNPAAGSYPSTFCGFYPRTDFFTVVNGSETTSTTEPTVDYTVGYAFDFDAKTIDAYINGVQGNQASFSSVDTPLLYINWANQSNIANLNFGQRPFAYTPPSGYKSLCTQSLDNPLIKNPSTAFNTKLWTGTGAARSITTTGMSPDLVWIKMQSGSAGHRLYDTVRGATKYLVTQGNDAEATQSAGLTSFNSDGFSLGSNFDHNNNNSTFVGWAWDMGSTTQTISAGGLNSSVYNQSATWTNDLTTNSGTSWFGGAAANAFDGSTSTFVQGAIGYDVTFTPTTGIAVANSMRIWADSGSGFGVGNGPYTITYNGTQVYSGSMWSSPYTITAAAGTTFSSLVIAPSGGEAMRLFAVEIDGKLLVNSNASVANVPALGATVKANQDAGQSIVSYVGNGANTTLPHGLLQAPELIIAKDRTSADAWQVWVEGFSSNEYLYLNLTDAKGSYSGTWGSTPTNSVFGVYNQGINQSGNNFIAYCFHSVPSFSKVGVYQGNGSSDGTYVHLGFRPIWLMIKRTDSTGNWVIIDAARSPYNEVNDLLYAEQSLAETTDDANNGIDFLSNGFKLRKGVGGTNLNGATLIYYAIAETPGKYSRAR